MAGNNGGFFDFLMTDPNMQRSLAPSVKLRDKAIDAAIKLLTSDTCPDQLSLKMLFTADVGTRRIAENISKCTQLRSLDMSSNWIPDDSICAFMDEVRAHRRLTRLNLASNKITAAGSDAVAKALEPVADGGGILKWLRLDLNPLASGSEVILGAISRNNTITKLDMKNTSMTPAAFAGLITIFATNHKLRHLSISSNPKHLTSALLVGIGNVIKLNETPALRSLDLTGVFADTSLDTAQGVAQLLGIPTLRKLVIGGNRINDRMIVPIADALKTNTTLQTLDLQRNMIGDAGVIALSVALMDNKDSSLRSLQLDRNQIGDAGGVAICNLLRATRTRRMLQHVYLEGNRLSDACSGMFLDLLRDHLDLYSLTLNLNKFTCFSALAAAYTTHPTLFEKYNAMALTPEETAKLKATSAANRRRYANRKHVALLMGTHPSIGAASPIYRHMRQSPIYDPHVLPILLSFIPTARVLEYSMDAGGVISKSWRATGHWAATGDENDATIITATDLPAPATGSLDPFAAPSTAAVATGAATSDTKSSSTTTTPAAATPAITSSLDWRGGTVTYTGPADPASIAQGVASHTVEGAARALTSAALFLGGTSS